MIKRVFIVHGWDGYIEEGWFPWLKNELEKQGFSVEIPTMPTPDEPKIEPWVLHLAKQIGKVDKNTYFVGHSIGCQTILRYFESLDNEKIGGAVFVAPWLTLKNLETDEEKQRAKPWLEKTIDFEKVKKHTQKFVAIFSNNDPVVPIENKKMFKDKLGAKTLTEQNKGHFSGDDNVVKLPSVLEAVLNIAK